jgi:S-adenosylmethionine decarboxylase
MQLRKAMAQVLSVIDKKFDPNGCTILILLSESHLSIHTYPEEEFAAIDCYTCGKDVDPRIFLPFTLEHESFSPL